MSNWAWCAQTTWRQHSCKPAWLPSRNPVRPPRFTDAPTWQRSREEAQQKFLQPHFDQNYVLVCQTALLQPAGQCSKRDVVFIQEHGGHVRVGQVQIHASIGGEVHSLASKLEKISRDKKPGALFGSQLAKQPWSSQIQEYKITIPFLRAR